MFAVAVYRYFSSVPVHLIGMIFIRVKAVNGDQGKLSKPKKLKQVIVFMQCK